MSQFYSITKIKDQISTEDVGISIKSLLKLIQGNEFEEELKIEFKSEIETNTFITIPGSATLVSDVLSRDFTFRKFDVMAGLDNIDISSNDDFKNLSISFQNLEDPKVVEIVGGESFTATAIHSSGSDFLDGFFRMKKFTEFLKEHKNYELIDYNLNQLKSQHKEDKKFERNYRGLKDSEGDYFIRAITSTNRYYDYNIRFSIFIGIMSLYRASNSNQKVYSVNYYSFDESNIRITFEQSGGVEINKVGTAKYSIELSNDEIKREAFRFRGISSIFFQNGEKHFDIQPRTDKNYSSTILSISHGTLPKNWLNKINEISSSIRNTQENLISDIKEIESIKHPDQVRFALHQSFKRASSEQITHHKNEIVQILSAKITSMSDLLNSLNKIHYLANEDLEAREYIRYVFHDCLVRKRNN